MQDDLLPLDDRAGRAAERLRPSESYIHWERGLAIVAGIIGIVLLFFLLMVGLPIREQSGGTQLGGLATVVAVAATPTPVPQRAATAIAPPTGPDQPRLQATARQFPFVRRGPGINFAVIMNLQQGQRVEVVGRNADRQWLKIVLPENARERGWVSADLLGVEGDIGTLPEERE